MGRKTEVRTLNAYGSAPKILSDEFTSIAGVTNGWTIVWDDTDKGFKPAAPGGVGIGGAPQNASYITLGANATLTAERIARDGKGLEISDNGTSAGVTFDVVLNPEAGISMTHGIGSAGISVGIYFSGENTGDLPIRKSTGWDNLAYSGGVAGQVLTHRGTGVIPSWQDGGGGSTWESQTIPFATASSTTVTQRVKVPSNYVLVDVQMRATTQPSAGWLKVEKDDDGTTVSCLAGSSYVVTALATNVETVLGSAGLTTDSSTLTAGASSWYKVSAVNLNIGLATQGHAFDIAMKFTS